MGEIADLTANYDICFEDLEQTPRPSCRYCGERDLSWGKYKGKWRLYDEYDLHICNFDSKATRCKYCGENDLKWKHKWGKWRLYNGNTLHNCPCHKD